MGGLRYELTEAQWRRIEPLLPGRFGTVGRPAEDNRRFVNGVLWVIRSGMRWADLPERYGKYKSVHKRFVRWAEAGVWDRLFDAIVAAIHNLGATAVIPSRRCRKQQRSHDRTLYKLRNRIERCFNRLKHFRRLATRYCKRRTCFQATVALACAWLHLTKYVDTP